MSMVVQLYPKQQFIMEVLTFIFKNVSPVFIILILGIIALNNFGNLFKEPKKTEDTQSQIDFLDSKDMSFEEQVEGFAKLNELFNQKQH